MLALVSVEADVTTFERQFLPTGSQRVHNIFMRRERSDYIMLFGGLVIYRQANAFCCYKYYSYLAMASTGYIGLLLS